MISLCEKHYKTMPILQPCKFIANSTCVFALISLSISGSPIRANLSDQYDAGKCKWLYGYSSGSKKSPYSYRCRSKSGDIYGASRFAIYVGDTRKGTSNTVLSKMGKIGYTNSVRHDAGSYKHQFLIPKNDKNKLVEYFCKIDYHGSDCTREVEKTTWEYLGPWED